MANPDKAWLRIQELDTENDDSDVHNIATFCVELELQVIRPLKARVSQLEKDVDDLKSRLAMMRD